MKMERYLIMGTREFEEFERWLAGNLTEFQEFLSLGGKVHFRARYDQHSVSIVIKNSKYKEKFAKNPKFDGYALKRRDVKRIFERFIHASDADRFRPGYYMLPPSKKKYYDGAYAIKYWPDAPDKIATPAVAAVIKSWFLERRIAMNNLPLRRVRYFFGQVLSVNDLAAEQEYFLEKHRRHNRTLHGAGVVSGLEVSRQKDSVVVQPGLGLNCRGEEISICEPVELAFPEEGEKAYLILSYAEKMTAPVPAAGEDMQFSRIEESFKVAFEPDDLTAKHKWRKASLVPCGDPHGFPLAKLFFIRGRWRIDRRFRRPQVLPR
jgi:hypothetical protein